MIKPAPKNQDGKLYRNMPDKASFVVVRRKGKIHGCFISNNKLLRLTTDDENDHLEGMICVAKVIDIVPNINAAFLRIAGERKCFIHLDDLMVGKNLSRPGMNFSQGDNVLIQVTKEASKDKEASASTNIRMEGRFCVVSFGKKDILFSHKIPQNRRGELENSIKTAGFTPANNIQVIIRTEAAQNDVSVDDIIAEACLLSNELHNLYEKALHRSDYSVLKEVTPKYLNFLIETKHVVYDKILTDDKTIFEEIKCFLELRSPELREKLHFYEDCLVPLNVLYGLEGKFSEALSDKVWLKCGGFLYIEPTKALTVIDVNSGKYDKKSSGEETYLRVNLEAAEEIATQIFLRNLTGIILIDFINMKEKQHQEELLKKLMIFLRDDVNSARVLGYTRLGLVEITRKKTDKTIYEQILV